MGGRAPQLITTRGGRPAPGRASGEDSGQHPETHSENTRRQGQLVERRHSRGHSPALQVTAQPCRSQVTLSRIAPTDLTVASFTHFMISINQQEEINIFLSIPSVSPSRLCSQKAGQRPRSHRSERGFQEAVFWQRARKLQVKHHPHSSSETLDFLLPTQHPAHLHCLSF